MISRAASGKKASLLLPHGGHGHGRGTLGKMELRRASAHGAKASTLARWIGLVHG